VKGILLVQRLKMQQSADVVDTSGASSGADADSNSFKTLWKKAINKLKLRRTSSADDSKLSSTSPKADEGFVNAFSVTY